jgi:phosphoglycolate phosphatase-like HAD superfamily hydrolase
MCPTILLFDVDGTLVTTAGAGRRAMERAFAARFGRPHALRDVVLHGMTDRAIVRAGLAAVGAPVVGSAAEATIDDVLTAYVELLADEVARADGLRLQPGITAALDAAAGCPGVGIGLGTGNIREGARLKLERVGIFDRFAFGGFGCDHEDRAELLRLGVARGARALGVAQGDCRVVVVGDTPRDVAAARAIGAECLAVATSRFDAEGLRRAGATYAFEDLAAAGALAALLG